MNPDHKTTFTCPCCGHRTLESFPGSYEICPVCFWEDDPVQLLDPNYRGGANGPSLRECQANYRRFGACEERHVQHVRALGDGDELDPEWCPATERTVDEPRRPKDISDADYERLETLAFLQRARTTD
jgi:hypothetical protein